LLSVTAGYPIPENLSYYPTFGSHDFQGTFCCFINNFGLANSVSDIAGSALGLDFGVNDQFISAEALGFPNAFPASAHQPFAPVFCQPKILALVHHLDPGGEAATHAATAIPEVPVAVFNPPARPAAADPHISESLSRLSTPIVSSTATLSSHDQTAVPVTVTTQAQPTPRASRPAATALLSSICHQPSQPNVSLAFQLNAPAASRSTTPQSLCAQHRFPDTTPAVRARTLPRSWSTSARSPSRPPALATPSYCSLRPPPQPRPDPSSHLGTPVAASTPCLANSPVTPLRSPVPGSPLPLFQEAGEPAPWDIDLCTAEPLQ
jgi:hypothetical protein